MDEHPAHQLQRAQQDAGDGVAQEHLCGNTTLGGSGKQINADHPSSTFNLADVSKTGLLQTSAKLSSSAPPHPQVGLRDEQLGILAQPGGYAVLCNALVKTCGAG